jgi:hypothetical protein
MVLAISTLATSVGVVSAATPAAPQPATPGQVEVTPTVTGDFHLTPDQLAQANAMWATLTRNNLISEFAFDASGHLALKDPIGQVAKTYSLSPSDQQLVQQILKNDQKRGSAVPSAKQPAPSPKGGVTPQLYLNGTVLYLTFSDMTGLLFTAATMGPVALAIAIDGVATIFGGPIGTAVGVIMLLISGPSLVSLAKRIIAAHALHEGIYFGVEWNWIIPFYTDGLWCGCN